MAVPVAFGRSDLRPWAQASIQRTLNADAATRRQQMRSLVIYESSYGNTHRIAEALAEGLRKFGDVDVRSVDEAPPDSAAEADLLVVGGPTHVHGMSRLATRRAAVQAAADPEKVLHLDHEGVGSGVRDWLDQVSASPTAASVPAAAAFDTRVDAPAIVTGRASKGIARRLRGRGFDVIVEPISFLVDKTTELEPGELVRATEWGRRLGEAFERRRREFEYW
jgi:hypothetical protein